MALETGVAVDTGAEKENAFAGRGVARWGIGFGLAEVGLVIEGVEVSFGVVGLITGLGSSLVVVVCLFCWYCAIDSILLNSFA